MFISAAVKPPLLPLCCSYSEFVCETTKRLKLSSKRRLTICQSKQYWPSVVTMYNHFVGMGTELGSRENGTPYLVKCFVIGVTRYNRNQGTKLLSNYFHLKNGLNSKVHRS